MPVPRAVAPPNYWNDFELPRDHVALVRFAFFAVLAVDAFLQIAHAPRYGGDFNVPQFAWLPLPSPGREGALAIDLVLTYLFVLAALGVATRVVVPLAAALDAYYYFSSQLDSYQHHYLVVMLLVIASFVPWDARERYVKSWALRLFCVQIAILYAWAAIAKLDGAWLDGTTLRAQVRPEWTRDLLDAIGWSAAAWGVVLAEVFLAVAWLWPRLWPYALVPGVGFHAGIELADFRIGQFSYVMIAIYLLMLPRAIGVAPARALAGIRIPDRFHAAALGAALVAGAALLVLARVPVSVGVVVAISAIGVVAFAQVRRWTVGAAHLAACALVLALGLVTDQAVDYYKFWAGSSRRLGKTDEMRRAYRELVAIEPAHGPANYYLGVAALEAQDLDGALRHFRTAQAAQPDAARGWVGEARVWLARGDAPAARAALQGALRAEPSDQEAQQLLRQISR